MRINHNIPALYALNALSDTNSQLQKTIRNLSTGLRINSAADDAAGLAISEKMRGQIRGIDQALRNSQDGISMIQTAEGALTEAHSILQRIRELTVQAANDTITSEDRTYIQGEIDQLKDEINRIANTTQFNKKLLLNGNTSVLWSSDRLSTEVIVRGGLDDKDQFGQKISTEGNYKINITAEPGAAQVQKSNILDVAYDKLKPDWHTPSTPPPTPRFTPDFTIDITTGADSSGAFSGTGWNFAAGTGVLTITGSGTYEITDGAPSTNSIVVASGVTANVILSNVDITSTGCAFNMNGANVTLLLEGNNTLTSGGDRAGLEASGSNSTLTIYSSVTGGSGTLTANGSGNGAGIGSSNNVAAGNITINSGVITARGGTPGEGAGIGGGFVTGIVYGGGGGAGVITINGGTVNAFGGTGGFGGAGIGTGHLGAGGTITINGGTINANGGAHGSGIGAAHDYTGTRPLATVIINGGSGTVRGGANMAGIGGGDGHPPVVITLVGEYDGATGVLRTRDGNLTSIPGAGYYVDGIVDITPMPDEYDRTPKLLREISEFYNVNGVLTVRQPQTVTIYQGDDKSTSVTLYADDTMYSVAKKINDAIAFDLGYGTYAENATNFCTISDGTENTSESIFTAYDPYYGYPARDLNGNIVREAEPVDFYKHYYATMLVRSAVPGANGELYFSGDEELLHALGLNTIQQSKESEFTVTVYDAHTGNMVNSPQKVSGNVIYGAVTDNIDVKFSPLANINVSWNELTKSYSFSQISEPYTTIVHMANNATTLQVGANEQEDLTIRFSDISASALGLDGILVVSRELASRAITRLDAAITKVSKQRALLGAYQNRLEHTVTNLKVASTNTTAAESRIRDADMAREMLNFTRLNILTQSGTSMLGQANQLPQYVLSLLR